MPSVRDQLNAFGHTALCHDNRCSQAFVDLPQSLFRLSIVGSDNRIRRGVVIADSTAFPQKLRIESDRNVHRACVLPEDLSAALCGSWQNRGPNGHNMATALGSDGLADNLADPEYSGHV